MITLHKIRELDLSGPPGPGRPSHLSAASGLVRAGAHLYVVADDERHLGVFHATGARAGHLLRLFAGKLPASPVARKARKPDLEALTLLPPVAGYPHGALFAFGSGSTRERRRGALLALDEHGEASGAARICDLSNLFTALDERLTSPNIEGAVVSGADLCLLQRGNRRVVQNAIVRFRLSAVLDALLSGAPVAPVAMQAFELGSVNGIPLCFTDGAALPNGDIVFTAVAEDTPDAYQDGPCAGAAVGVADREGNRRCLHRLDRPHKIEGVDARVDGDVIRLLLVTDADDPGVPAGLYSAVLEKSYTLRL
ncbi:MAG: hypothetical protein HY322_12285 [Betaproteobacteria bacterium]|nr:hypothetical protein [Betaproteobacteria bacterium]